MFPFFTDKLLGLFQNLFQFLDALLAEIVEGLAAVAHGIAHQGHGLFDDGVGIAEGEHPLEGDDGVLGRLGLLQIPGHEAVVDGGDGPGPEVGPSGHAAGAARLQAGEDVAVVPRQNGEVLVQILGELDVGFQIVQVAAGVLGAQNHVHVLGKLGHRLRQQLVSGAGGDVVQHDGDVDVLGHLAVVVVQLLLAGQGKAGGDDGQGVRAQLLGPLAQVDGVPGGDAAGSGVDGDAALDLVHGGLQNLLLFLQAEDVRLAVGAEGKNAVDAAGDLPLNLVAELRNVDAFVLGVHGGDDRGNDALDFELLHARTLLL